MPITITNYDLTIFFSISIHADHGNQINHVHYADRESHAVQAKSAFHADPVD